jgi:hypothetical protein
MVVRDVVTGRNGVIKTGDLSITCYYLISPMAARDLGKVKVFTCGS